MVGHRDVSLITDVLHEAVHDLEHRTLDEAHRRGKYRRDIQNLRTQIPAIGNEIDLRIRWFRKNPQDTRLDDHGLHRRMEGKSAFSITGNIRIVYKWTGKNSVCFLNIGKHEEVYGRKSKESYD